MMTAQSQDQIDANPFVPSRWERRAILVDANNGTGHGSGWATISAVDRSYKLDHLGPYFLGVHEGTLEVVFESGDNNSNPVPVTVILTETGRTPSPVELGVPVDLTPGDYFVTTDQTIATLQIKAGSESPVKLTIMDTYAGEIETEPPVVGGIETGCRGGCWRP